MSGYKNVDIYDDYKIPINYVNPKGNPTPLPLPSQLSSSRSQPRSQPRSPQLSSQLSAYQSRLSSRSRSPRLSSQSSPHKGGVNLTPLISALLLAGIKLSLEQNKKTKKVASNSKSTKTKPRRRTI